MFASPPICSFDIHMTVLVATQRPQSRPQSSSHGNQRVAIDECSFCHEKGHWKKDCPKLRNKDKGILPSPHQTSHYNRNAFKPSSSGPISAFSSHSAAASSDRTFNQTAITHEEVQSLVAQQIQQLLGTSLESRNAVAMSGTESIRVSETVVEPEDASPSSTLVQDETPSQSDPPAIFDDVDPTTSQVEISQLLRWSTSGPQEQSQHMGEVREKSSQQKREAKLPCRFADDVCGTSDEVVEGNDMISDADGMWESLALASPLMHGIDERAEEFIARIRGEMQLQEMMARRL
ncbi:hypothetical protein RHSIM_Rhsim13G0034900 [Rhododendron simsii]|uniref:CCHC-type domain-containing protein n=1 Tax=Rhododendron simsii TaxID=118357 RepID=A0A834FX19_RHOSS|nr:hypothetical protein RHSIM_Rhsim13G0034900 [Rhododendron simsii]